MQFDVDDKFNESINKNEIPMLSLGLGETVWSMACGKLNMADLAIINQWQIQKNVHLS